MQLATQHQTLFVERFQEIIQHFKVEGRCDVASPLLPLGTFDLSVQMLSQV